MQYYNLHIRLGLVSVLFILLCGPLLAQEPADSLQIEGGETFYTEKMDSLQLTTKLYPNPKKAAWMSAILPGLGQAYNKKYWKIPILYAGLGTVGYFITWNNTFYKDYKEGYHTFLIKQKDPDADVDESKYTQFFPPGVTEENLDKAWFENAMRSKKDYFRRNRDLLIITFVGVYVLNILDANIDAHLYHFDISEDLSMSVDPLVSIPQEGYSSVGLQCKFRF